MRETRKIEPIPPIRPVRPLEMEVDERQMEGLVTPPSTLLKAPPPPADSFSYACTKPTLEKPKSTSYVWEMLRTLEDYENTSTEITLGLKDRFQTYLTEMKTVNKKEGEKYEEFAEKADDVTFWGVLQEVSGIILGAVSAILGFSLLASSAPVVGGMLIAAGILSVTNVLFKYTEIWDWITRKMAGDNDELQKTLVTYIPAAVGIVSTILGLAGGVGAWYFAQLGGTDRVLAIAETVLSLVQGVSALATGVTGSRAKWVSVEISELNSEGQKVRLLMENALHEMSEMGESTGTIGTVGNICKSYTRSIQATHQIV